MAAPILQEYTFEHHAPSIAEVVDDLIVATGLLIEFDTQPGGIEGSTIWKIRSLSAPMQLVIIAEGRGQPAYAVGYDPFCKWTPYLAGTLQWVFAKRGGACAEEIPEWAGRRWAEVRKTWSLG